MIEPYDRIRHNTENVKDLLALALGPSTPETLRKLLYNVYEVKDYLLFVTLDQGTSTGPVNPHPPMAGPVIPDPPPVNTPVTPFPQITVSVNPSPSITGIIGIDNAAAPHGWILHLAVHPSFRNRGIGRGLIDQVMQRLSWESASLETDQNAVHFYRSCGFTAGEISSKWPGVRRFRCSKGQPPKSVLKYYDNKRLPEY